MNKVYNKFLTVFLFTVFVSYTSTSVAGYQLPTDYTTSEAAADAAVTEARAKTLEAVKALQVVIKQFKAIVENGKEDDKVINDMLAEIKRLEQSGGGSSVNQGDSITISRKALARVASQKGNGFKSLSSVLDLLKTAVKNKPDDNKWKPIKGALGKATNKSSSTKETGTLGK